MPPTSRHGKVCYLQIPADDADASARFYAEVFGWSLRRHGDGTQAFDDTIGEVSGMFVPGRKPWAGQPGLIVDIMVDDAEQAVAAIVRSSSRSAVTPRRSRPGSGIRPATSWAFTRNPRSNTP